jgi:hypothetical protein
MSRRLLLGATLAATITVAGCTADTPNPPPPPARTFDPNALRLVAFDSCDRLTDELRAAAKEAVGPWGFEGGMRAMESGAADAASGARNAAGPMPAAGKAATPEYSGTNVHEQGVDEPDIVKTDGRRIVTVTMGTLRVVDAATRRLTAEVGLGMVPGGQTDLLLSGDRALVLVHSLTGRYPMRIAMPEGGPAQGPQVILVDLSAEPRVLSRFEGEGELVDARLTGSTARVVLRSSPRIAFPDLPNRNDEDERVKANRKAIDRASADAWLPGWTVTDGDTTERGKVGCGQVSRPPVFSGSSVVSVHTFDLAEPKLGNGDPVSVVADGDTVYGTPTSLYIASDQRWRLDFWPGRDNRRTNQRTEIYRFDTPAGAKPVYAAAGSVPGWLVNQYALSEWNGHLRVATTDESAQSSAVRVLKQQDDKLAQVGVIDGLGKGERIYSARFIGPRGYLVTFRQTDPLYSVDLSNPAKPRVTGELKITGYSAHLQPIDEGRLIGIGQEATVEGRTQGTQISLFDVSNMADPRRLAQYHVANGHSEAEYDPHAILWWPATKLLVVPMVSFDSTKSMSQPSALALRVTDAGLAEVGTVEQPVMTEGYRPSIQRSLVIGDVLWTYSDAGLQASSLSTMESLAYIRNR